MVESATTWPNQVYGNVVYVRADELGLGKPVRIERVGSGLERIRKVISIEEDAVDEAAEEVGFWLMVSGGELDMLFVHDSHKRRQNVDVGEE